MKKAIFLLVLIGCVIAQSKAQAFEGTFVMHVQDDNSVNMMNIAVRKDKLLLQPIDPTIPKSVKVLLSQTSDDVYVLTEEQGMKFAIKYTFKKPPALADSLKPVVSYQETGKTKKIEGFACREVLVDDNDGHRYEVWVTNELGITMSQFSEYLGKFSAALNGGSYDESTKYNQSEIYQKNMALEIKELKEKDATMVWIKKIVKTSLPESDFSTEGYVVMDAQDILGGEKK